MNLFFYSDPHFGHGNVIKYCNRPYDSVHKMNEDLIKRYNSRVGVDDICIWLGDSFICNIDRAKDIMSRLNGKKILIRGNHDPSVTRCYRIGFDFVCEDMTMKIAGKYVKLHHFPYKIPWWKTIFKKYDMRRNKYRLKNQGKWLVHGHVHNSWGKINKNQINISCDVWDRYPVNKSTIEKIIQRGRL